MKKSDDKVNRSGLYYLMSPIVPINHVIKARADTAGAVVIVALLVCTVSIMRMVLAWAQ